MRTCMMWLGEMGLGESGVRSGEVERWREGIGGLSG